MFGWENGATTIQPTAFDLILLDWGIPEIDGLSVCKAIRENDVQTPIIFLTARNALSDTISRLRAGANDYIKKPFNFEELLERIKIHFRPEATLALPLELGNIKVDTNKYL